MTIEILMPRLSDDMEQGTVIRWIVAEGQSVAVGDAIAEIETDKANVEIEAEAAGIVSRIVVAEGASAPVGAVIAQVEDASSPRSDAGATTPSQPAVEESETGQVVVPAAMRESGGAKAATPAPRSASKSTSASAKASPVARRLAEQQGVDLVSLRGSGPGGRIVKRDVEDVLEKRGGGAPAAVETAPPSSAASAAPKEMSRMRRTIAARMEKAKREIPHFYLRVEVDAGELVRIYKSSRANDLIPGLTLTHLLVRAIGLTLPSHPRLNALWIDDTIQIEPEVNVGIVVAVDDGLLVPVLKQAHRLGIRALVHESRALVERARSGKMRSDDLIGGTISISNIGMLDVDELAPIINAPQAAVIGVGSVRQRALVRDGQVVVGESMHLTLACDHRVANGIEAGRFLESLKHLLEQPLALVAESVSPPEEVE